MANALLFKIKESEAEIIKTNKNSSNTFYATLEDAVSM